MSKVILMPSSASSSLELPPLNDTPIYEASVLKVLKNKKILSEWLNDSPPPSLPLAKKKLLETKVYKTLESCW